MLSSRPHRTLAVLFTLLAFMYFFLGLQSFLIGSTSAFSAFLSFAAMLAIGALGCHLERRPFYRIGVVLVLVSFAGLLYALRGIFAYAHISVSLLIVFVVVVTNVLILCDAIPLSRGAETGLVESGMERAALRVRRARKRK